MLTYISTQRVDQSAPTSFWEASDRHFQSLHLPSSRACILLLFVVVSWCFIHYITYTDGTTEWLNQQMKMLLTTGGFSPRWRYGRTLQLVICVLALSETTSVLAVAGVDVAKLQPQAQPALQPELQANIQPIQSVHSAKPTKLKETTNSKLTAVIKRARFTFYVHFIIMI